LAESGGVVSGCNDDGCDERENGHRSHSLARYDTHPIPEEDEEDEEHSDDSDSWNGDEKEEKVTSLEEKKDDNDASATSSAKKTKKKTISRPGRPILPSRISSNIGWGPSNTTATAATAANDGVSSKNTEANHHPPPRTVSEMGRGMYRPYPTQSSTSFGSYNQLKDGTTLAKKTASSSPCPPPPPTPAWKLIGGTLKLLGLMGFWAFDNFSFLTTSGFLDPIHLGNPTSTSNSSGATKSNSVTSVRTRRKKWASENAARCYFMGGLAGLYVNLRSFWIHRNGALAEARRKYHDGSSDDSSNDDNGDAQAHAQQQRRNALKKIEQKHFELFLALVKSICDVTVFSNNPGIDLHLKLRGKKNHEGLHCLCGLISASTVLYNNFPNVSE
jgi:hypothetical protein